MEFKVHYWPILASAWIVLTFIVSYLIAVLTETVHPLFPYISDTGAIPPASCVFGQMLNIGAVITAISLYIRYRQVNFAINSGEVVLSSKWNTVAFWLGNIVALGISIVGNFQGNVKGSAFVLIVHIVGALMAFGIGAIYITIQTRISFGLRQFYNEYPQYGVGQGVLYLRIILAVSFYIFFLATFICGIMGGNKFTGDDHTWWTSEQGGYGLHLTSSFSEWLMVFVFLAYMATVTKEFKSLNYEEIRFTRPYHYIMKFKLHYWPALTSGWIVLTFIVSYVVAVLTDSVLPFFPYISDTGAFPPASCVFGQMMNIAAVLTAISLYIRYRQVDFVINSGDALLPKKWNLLAFWLGNIIALGISFVANFQADMEGSGFVLTMHFVGALMAFGIGAVYLTVQIRISFALKFMNNKYPEYGVGRNILYFRIFLTVWFYIFFFATFIAASISMNKFTGDDHTWWTSEYEGFVLHLVSTFSEWLMVFVFLVYMTTVTKEFKSLEYEQISFKNNCATLGNKN